MTPKEKAKEVVKKYIEFRIDGRPRIFGISLSKQFALIAVEEIINSVVITDLTIAENQFIYWEEVKQEIEKL